MKSFLLTLVFLLAAMTPLLADPALASAQQELKSQGFYYGAITGQKDADTTAALKRFQIRNGLKVSGELDGETLKALKLGLAEKTTPATPSNSATPRTARNPMWHGSQNQGQQGYGNGGRTTIQEAPDEQGAVEQGDDEAQEYAPNQQPYGAGPQQQPYGPGQQQQPYGPGQFVPPSAGGHVFSGTPYAAAPFEVQRQVVADVQMRLARRGLYRAEVDGIFGPGTEFALRAFQSETGLAATGRLDMETLASMRLLPNQGRRFYARPQTGRPNPNHVLPGQWVR